MSEPPPRRAFLRCMDEHQNVLAEIELPAGTEWTQLVQQVVPGQDVIAVMPIIEATDQELYQERYDQ